MVDKEARLRMMDQFPRNCQILSLASPIIEAIATPEETPDLGCFGNDTLCAMAAAYSDRFPGWIALLPTKNMDAACAEVSRAFFELGAVGMQIYTNVVGQPLDEPEFLKIIEHATAIDIPIWLHSIHPMGISDYSTEGVSKFDLWSLRE
ncbi:MAG: amidohydrolase family protein [Gemmataceae bacterium]